MDDRTDVLGPVSYLIVEFPGNKMTGQQLVDGASHQGAEGMFINRLPLKPRCALHGGDQTRGPLLCLALAKFFRSRFRLRAKTDV